MRYLGIILICLGLLGFFISGISVTTEDTVADLGPLQIQEEEERTIPVTPVASGVVLIVGVGLVYAGRRSREQ